MVLHMKHITGCKQINTRQCHNYREFNNTEFYLPMHGMLILFILIIVALIQKLHI